MTRRAKLWLLVAVLFTVINVLGAGYAVAMGEEPHAALHGVLSLLGAFLIWLVLARTRAAAIASVPRGDDRLEQLQQSMDAVALEVERIGEAQRFTAKLQSDRAEPLRTGVPRDTGGA